MRQSGTNRKIWPPVVETFQSGAPGNIQRIAVDGIDLCQGFNEIRRVALVAAKSGPHRVGVDCDSQVAWGSLSSIKKMTGAQG